MESEDSVLAGNPDAGEAGDRTVPDDAQVRAVRRAQELMITARGASPDRLRAAVEELEGLRDTVRGDTKIIVEYSRIMIMLASANADNDESVLRRLAGDVDNLREAAAGRPEAASTVEFLAEMVGLMAAQRRGDDPWAVMTRLRDRIAQLGIGEGLDPIMAETFTMMNPLRPIYQQSQADHQLPGVTAAMPTTEQIDAIKELTRQPGRSDEEKAFHLAVLGFTALGGGYETDPERVDSGIDSIETALALIGPGHSQRPFFLYWLSTGLVRRHERTRDVADRERAAGALEEARDRIGGPHHQLWSDIHELLSHVRRRLSGPEVRTVALDGLRSNVRRVLLQSDLAAARIAVKDAAEMAIRTARMCIQDGEPADAIAALEAGRGLTLFAAAGFRDVASRLVAAGRQDLADKWRPARSSGTPDDLSPALRQEILTVLSERAGLLEPPGIGEIRHALRTLDADAIVYLVPSDPPFPGWAVIAAAEGPLSYLDLYDLTAEKGRDVDRYVSTLSRRDVSPVAEPTELAANLDSLCDWAWRAAVGPLVEQLLPTLPPPASGRPYHLVLVPVGELALVPWAAARRPDGRYAIQLVAFSQAVSARMLCDSATRAPVPPTRVGLVVGNPDTGHQRDDLVAAGAEAYAIHQAFYRGGRYLGRRADNSGSSSGRGRADEVRAWLASTVPGAGGMLHLACHGVVEPGATSYLLLADGGRLTAEELVDVMATSPERAIGLVVLAACRTGRAVDRYDEAYSLGTAFLAGGARSVLSTQWSIPDSATSVLMFRFHHYLTASHRSAWAALRQAQLWMLDPHREVPPNMPPQLRTYVDDVDPAQVIAWAGFVPWGQ